MNINIAGRHMDVGQSLEEHTHARLEHLQQYFNKVNDADVSFRHGNASRHVAEMTVHANGVTLRAVGVDTENFFAAVDHATDKLEAQLKRYKGRLRRHRERRDNNAAKYESFPAVQTVHQVVSAPAEEESETEVAAALAQYEPQVIKKDIQTLQPMTIDEAIMHMDLQHAPCFAFLNEQTGDINVVYRQHGSEEDATVVWVEPHKAEVQSQVA